MLKRITNVTPTNKQASQDQSSTDLCLKHILTDKVLFQELKSIVSLFESSKVLTKYSASQFENYFHRIEKHILCVLPQTITYDIYRKTIKDLLKTKAEECVGSIVLKIFLTSHRCKHSSKHRKAKNKALLLPSFLVIVLLH